MTNLFIPGPISPLLIADSILELGSQSGTGGHSIFLGQIRGDLIDGKPVKGIEYSAYEEMAIVMIEHIKTEIKKQFTLTSMIVHHSLGTVRVGELCLFVFTSAAHRKAAIEACQLAVERIKKEVPVWGKELFDNDSYAWKVNT